MIDKIKLKRNTHRTIRSQPALRLCLRCPRSANLNGCPEELTDANGEILWECSFQLWGKRI
ncbi:MAG: RHS domain-containing protein, partial [Apibacter sp.]|nr:RHS domain-containing protein [Apibacter sp.]